MAECLHCGRTIETGREYCSMCDEQPHCGDVRPWWADGDTEEFEYELPVNDIKSHIEDTTCDCHPKLEEADGGYIIIHNSWDSRENDETKEGGNDG